MQLEFPYLMNVVLYITDQNCIERLPYINKQMVSVMDNMKINPLLKQTATSFILKYFPNINTFQVPSLTCKLPRKYLDQISFIKITENLYLYQWNDPGSDYELVGMQEDGSSTFFTDKHYVYDLTGDFSPLTIGWRIENNKENEDNINIGDMLYWKHDLDYIERLENINIHSVESQALFLKHYKDFKGLKTLRIVIENECENEFFDNSSITNNSSDSITFINVLNHLQHSKTLKRVELISINAEITSILKETITKNQHIQFIISFYEYNNDYCSEYVELERYSNVHLQFMQLDINCVKHNFILSRHYPFVQLSKYYSEPPFCHINFNDHADIDEYNKLFDIMQYQPIISCFSFNKNEHLPNIHDLHINQLNLYNYIILSSNILPAILTELNINSMWSKNVLDLTSFKLIKLSLDNCRYFEIKIPSTLKDLNMNFNENLSISCLEPIYLNNFCLRSNNKCNISLNTTSGSQYYLEKNTLFIKNINNFEVSNMNISELIISNVPSLIISSVTIKNLLLQHNNNNIFTISNCDDQVRIVFNEKDSYFSIINTNVCMDLSAIQVKHVKFVNCEISMLKLSNTVEILTLQKCKIGSLIQDELKQLKQLKQSKSITVNESETSSTYTGNINSVLEKTLKYFFN
ncbi:Leucine-rich repeat containing protein [Entamoeba marina]